jgi:hypothetical protein
MYILLAFKPAIIHFTWQLFRAALSHIFYADVLSGALANQSICKNSNSITIKK